MSSTQTSFLSAIFLSHFLLDICPVKFKMDLKYSKVKLKLIVSYLPLNLLLLLTPPVLSLHRQSPWHLYQRAGGISLSILLWALSCNQSKHCCTVTHIQCFILVPVTISQDRAHTCNPWKPLPEFLSCFNPIFTLKLVHNFKSLHNRVSPLLNPK